MDDSDLITTRSLAVARYRRNHEFMNDVFMHAGFGVSLFLYYCIYFWLSSSIGMLKEKADPKPAYSIFNKEDLESKLVRHLKRPSLISIITSPFRPILLPKSRSLSEKQQNARQQDRQWKTTKLMFLWSLSVLKALRCRSTQGYPFACLEDDCDVSTWCVLLLIVLFVFLCNYSSL